MKSSTKDNVEGKMHQMTGKIMAVVGKVFKNRSMKAEGKSENLASHEQEKMNEIKKVVDK